MLGECHCILRNRLDWRNIVESTRLIREGEKYVEKADEFTIVVDIANIANLKALLVIRTSEFSAWLGNA